jgi:Tfp pilus assembly protein PilN
MRGLRRPKEQAVRELEFLPEDYLRARFHRRLGFLRSWLLLALGLAMVLWSLQMGAWVRCAQAELQALRGTGSAMEADVEKSQRLKAEAQDHNRRVGALASLVTKVGVADILAELADVLPPGVALEGAEIARRDWRASSPAVLRLRGSAPTETAVTGTVEAIEASALLEKAVLVESKQHDGADRTSRQFVVEASTIGPPSPGRSAAPPGPGPAPGT